MPTRHPLTEIRADKATAAHSPTRTERTDTTGRRAADDLLDWQQQIVDMADADEMTEAAGERLMELLHELASASRPPAATRRSRQTLIVGADRTLETRAGYRHATAQSRAEGRSYYGDPAHVRLRWRLAHGPHWSAGVAAEKDAGETWRSRLPWSDSYAAFVQWTGGRSLRRAIAGHYRLRLGEGLIVGQQFSLGKKHLATLAASATPALTRLSPHASLSEDDHMQGVAALWQVGRHLSLMPFASAIEADGAMHHDTLTSWLTTGLHRTRAERDRRHAAWLTDLGLRAAWTWAWGEVGANVVASEWQHDYVRPLRDYNRNVFRGHRLASASVDWRLHAFGWWLHGEGAVDDGRGTAVVATLSRRLGSDWQVAASGRHYGDTYRHLHGSALSEASAMQGERGATLTGQGAVGRRLTLSLLADVWRHTLPRSGISQPSRGSEGQALLTHERQRLRLSLRYGIKHAQRDAPASAAVDGTLIGWVRHGLDASLAWSPWASASAGRHGAGHTAPATADAPTPTRLWPTGADLLGGLTLRTMLKGRLYSAQASPTTDPGLSATVAADLRPARGLSGSVEATWFRADGYATRLYVVERAPLYTYSLPMLYGRGHRLATTLRIPCGRHLVVEAKYALMRYADHRTAISSGLQQIVGPRQQDVWLQLRAAW